MNQYLYLILNLGSLSIPLLYSVFEKKFHFIQYFRASVLSIVLIAIPFLIWDAFFTNMGVWYFNSKYHLPLKILQMPIEEWLFFFCIPYACLFTYEVLKYYLPSFKVSKSITKLISFSLLLLAGILLLLNFGKWYTTINFLLFLVVLAYGVKEHLTVLQTYFPGFLIILIPFFIVNGVLTGSFIEEPVVLYDNSENLGVRMFTIPLEDAFYLFNMLFPVQLLFNILKKKYYEK
ncbi:lycopene cyclase domain-containing protein [Aquimarina sediminis]|uniref:lycopene cyclase domain-containing protein n=1 Tax=Aquimarina sediminis TaxID=2070536 RepID=UPI000CA02D0B|nr:lycopene cyclase domain-containing protein [Aquimarina sediminis]